MSDVPVPVSAVTFLAAAAGALVGTVVGQLTLTAVVARVKRRRLAKVLERMRG